MSNYRSYDLFTGTKVIKTSMKSVHWGEDWKLTNESNHERTNNIINVFCYSNYCLPIYYYYLISNQFQQTERVFW